MAKDPKKKEVKTSKKKKGGWFYKIPVDVLLSPGGIILIILAGLLELSDLIPIPVFDQIWEIPLELLFVFFFFIIVEPPIKSLIIPLIIERIPFISDVCPTWLLNMFM